MANHNPLDPAGKPSPSPFTDPSQSAADNWLHNGGYDPPAPRPDYSPAIQQLPAWQHQHTSRISGNLCDSAIPLDNDNDPIQPPMPPEGTDTLLRRGENVHLTSERSPSVQNKTGEFWAPVEPDKPDNAPKHTGTDGKVPELSRSTGNGTAHGGTTSGPVEVPQQPISVRSLLTVLGVIAAVFALLLWLFNTLSAVQEVRVEGNLTISDAEIIRLSGITLGEGLPTDEELRQGIERSRYLEFISASQSLHVVTLRVHEREPVAYTPLGGHFYVLDRSGMVLEDIPLMDNVPTRLVQVKNWQVSACLLGQTIAVKEQELFECYLQLMIEFKALNMLDLISSVRLNATTDIKLETREEADASGNASSYLVSLGSDQHLHEKLRALLVTRQQLLKMGERGGDINVADPEYPTYTPSRLQ